MAHILRHPANRVGHLVQTSVSMFHVKHRLRCLLNAVSLRTGQLQSAKSLRFSVARCALADSAALNAAPRFGPGAYRFSQLTDQPAAECRLPSAPRIYPSFSGQTGAGAAKTSHALRTGGTHPQSALSSPGHILAGTGGIRARSSPCVSCETQMFPPALPPQCFSNQNR